MKLLVVVGLTAGLALAGAADARGRHPPHRAAQSRATGASSLIGMDGLTGRRGHGDAALAGLGEASLTTGGLHAGKRGGGLGTSGLDGGKHGGGLASSGLGGGKHGGGGDASGLGGGGHHRGKHASTL